MAPTYLPNTASGGRIGRDHDTYNAEDLWWVMHHSDDPNRRALAVTCYCDDTSSDKVAIISGLVMRRNAFINFNRQWKKLLEQYRIESVHMNEFVRPQGRYCAMYPELKIALFTSISKLICKNRVYSLSMGVPLVDFEEIVPELFLQLMRPYTMALFIVMMFNNAIAKAEGYQERLAYLMDHGNFEEQMLGAHKWVRKWEDETRFSSNVGTLAFANDADNTALQGADVVAWSSRRRDHEGLDGEYAPLRKIFEDRFDSSGKPISRHIHRVLPRKAILVFAQQVYAWAVNNGRLPSELSELVVVPPATKKSLK